MITHPHTRDSVRHLQLGKHREMPMRQDTGLHMRSISVYGFCTSVLVLLGCTLDQTLTRRDLEILQSVASHFASRVDTEWSAIPGDVLILPTTEKVDQSRKPADYVAYDEYVEKEVDVQLLQSFIRRNSKELSLVRLREVPGIRVATDAEIELMTAGTMPSATKVVVSLWTPGISRNGRRAYVCIALPGIHGSYANYLLVKTSGQWKVQSSSVVIRNM